jgi:WD40 repeat protein
MRVCADLFLKKWRNHAMTVSELEETYQQLHEQLLRGELNEEEFKAQVDQLRLKDNQGRQWKIGWYTGKWYRYDEGQWIQDSSLDEQGSAAPPPAVGAAPPTGEPRKRRSLTPCLVVVLIALLLVASVALVFGWNTDRWGRSTEETTAVVQNTTTEVATLAPSETPRPSATASAAPTRVSQATSAPSRTPSPTATRQRPTVTHTSETATPPDETATVEPTETTRPTSTTTPGPTSSTVTAPRRATSAAPSLSGRIYYPVYDPNPDRRTFDINVFEIGSGKRDVVIGQASQPALSPDGKRLAYRSWDSSRRGVFVYELAEGNTWRWIAFHEAAHPAWSPDGQNIVFASQQETDRRWRLYRTWGLESDRVRREGGDIFGRVPSWAADGRIIYWECPIDKCGLYAIHPDGTNLTRLTEQEHDTAPAPSPDSSQIAFMSNMNGNWEILATTTRPPSGENLPEPKRLTQNPARDGLPVWSPDGRWLAFVSDRSGAWAVWVMRPDGSDLQILFDLGGPLEGLIAKVPPEEQHDWTWETLAWGP